VRLCGAVAFGSASTCDNCAGAIKAAKLGESKAVTPTAENSMLQISGVVSGKRNIMCSAHEQQSDSKNELIRM
jgi:hypothetical protein